MKKPSWEKLRDETINEWFLENIGKADTKEKAYQLDSLMLLVDGLAKALLDKQVGEIEKDVEELEAEMVDGVGWNRMHDLVLDILAKLKRSK